MTEGVCLDQKPFWFGIDGLVVDGDLAKALNLPQSAGVLVQRVAEGSIASRWGIHAGKLRANVEGEELILGGDIILSVNDVPVEQSSSYDEIYASIGRLKPGDNLVISVFRQGQILKLSIPTAQEHPYRDSSLARDSIWSLISPNCKSTHRVY